MSRTLSMNCGSLDSLKSQLPRLRSHGCIGRSVQPDQHCVVHPSGGLKELSEAVVPVTAPLQSTWLPPSEGIYLGAGQFSGMHPVGLRYMLPGAHGGTTCYVGGMAAQPEITQRDLRNRSKEIMDAVQNGQAFTVTRDGHRIGELIPLRRRRRFVPRGEFAAMSRTASSVSLEAFRADQEATARQETDDSYGR